MKKIVVFTLFLIAAFSFSMMGQANAETWDLADDFSLTSNPNGNWTYGAYSGTGPASFEAYTGHEHNVLVSLDVWRDAGTDDPNIVKNTGVDVFAFNITFHAGKVTFGPTSGPAVARWTAPSTGGFKVVASFATVQSSNNQPDAYIFDGTNLDALGPVPAFSETVGYSQLLSLNANDTIDFVVDDNGSTKTTEVSATITQIPVFSCEGFQSPVANGAIKVKKNRVIPFKAELLDGDTPVIGTDPYAHPVIKVMFNSGVEGSTPEAEATLSAGQGTEGNQFVFSDGVWQFNLQTKNYTAHGTYTVTMEAGGDYIIDPTCEARFVIE